MIPNLIRPITICVLLLALFIAPAVTAQDPVIDSVEPASAPQGTQGLEVEIRGSGFDNSAEVFFYPTGTQDIGAITVRADMTQAKGSRTIKATIDIADAEQALGEYDIEVRLSGRRGGKGTTFKLFHVTPKNQNSETVACGTLPDGTPGVFPGVDSTDCNCAFTRKVEGGQGTPSVAIWVLQGDCQTSKMLTLPQYEVINGNGHTLTAIAPFTGPSVIANSGHRTHVFSLNIHIASEVAAGCGENDLQSAIGFVLDETKESPEDSTDADGRVYKLTRLRAWGIAVDKDSGALPLCRGIEFRREPSYENLLQTLPDPATTYTDAVAEVHNVQIKSGSYSEAGIRVSGFINAGVGGRSADKIGIGDSTVMGAYGTDGNAIWFGPVDGQGSVVQNAVSANGGTGIRVVGGAYVDGYVDEVSIQNNNVEHAATAIQVGSPEDTDPTVDSAYFKSNVLVGDGPGVGEFGIDTHALDNTYRSNRIDGFTCEVAEDGSCISP